MTIYPSTKGLSVYNALSLGGDMSAAGLLEYLRLHFDSDLSSRYVDDGIEFLREKGWISEDAGVVRLATRPRRAVRIKRDKDLALA